MSSKKTVGPVLHRLGEDLQQVAVLVAVDRGSCGPAARRSARDLADPLDERLVVVRVGRLEELDAAGAHLVDGAQDVVRRQRDVLHARAAVELEVLVDLRLPLAAAGSLRGNFTFLWPSATTLLMSAEYSVAMSAPTNSFMFEKPMTSL
jgi:hypothetical protein